MIGVQLVILGGVIASGCDSRQLLGEPCGGDDECIEGAVCRGAVCVAPIILNVDPDPAVTPEAGPDAAPEAAPDVTEDVAAEAEPDAAEDVATDVAEDVADDVAEDAAEDAADDAADAGDAADA